MNEVDSKNPNSEDQSQNSQSNSQENSQDSSIEGEVLQQPVSDDIAQDVVESDELGGAEHETEIAKLKDAFLRAKAEEDNIRRRAEKEVSNARKFAIEGFAKEMLNVFDSLTLATHNEPAEDADDTVKSIYDGSKITLNQLSSAFIKFSVKLISPEVGDKLNPNVHQAMSMVDSEEIDSGHIVSVIQAGFELHDRLLRPAMVVVAK